MGKSESLPWAETEVRCWSLSQPNKPSLKRSRALPASSRSERPRSMKRIGSPRNISESGATGTDWEAVESLTDEQINAAVLNDPDAAPVPVHATAGLVRVVDVK